MCRPDLTAERFVEHDGRTWYRTGDLVRDIGTVLVGKEAVANGLIDEVGGLGAAFHKLEQLIALNAQKGPVLGNDGMNPGFVQEGEGTPN